MVSHYLVRDFLLEHISSPDLVLTLVRKSKMIRFRKGEVMIRAGERSHRIGIITRGIVRWYTENPGEEDSVFQFFGEGDFVTEPFSFFNNDVATGSLQAIEDTDIYYLERETFEMIGEKHPEFVTESYRLLSKTMMRFLNEKNTILRLTATERYLFFLKSHPKLAHRISLGNISAFLGMRQSSLSRVRREISQTRKEEQELKEQGKA